MVRLSGEARRSLVDDEIISKDNAWSSEKTNEILQMANRLYEGKNLEAHFAGEIAAFDGDVWAWVRARVRSGNFRGINVGDFIRFITYDEHDFVAEIAGINTYKNYGFGENSVSNHIDFITRDCHPTPFVWNRVSYNNGTIVSETPWLGSDLYARLNSLQMNVPNSSAANPAMVNADYRNTGILTTLPEALRNVIIEKHALIPRRFTQGNLLVEDNGWDWRLIGKLWLPSEIEVYGCRQWGSNASPNQGLSSGGFQQYPIFTNNMRRVKRAGEGGERTSWWLVVSRGGHTASVCAVRSLGYAQHHGTANATNYRVPLCFRIA